MSWSTACRLKRKGPCSVPQDVSTLFDAQLDFTGSATRSLLSGEVTVARAAFNPSTDFASVLGETTKSTEPSEVTNPFLRGMQFDVRIVTAGSAEIVTSLTRDTELEANLRLRGGPAKMILLGRVGVNQGEILFFGNRYRIVQER
jgi:hypothetical protein